jgi:hypothetical protein
MVAGLVVHDASSSRARLAATTFAFAKPSCRNSSCLFVHRCNDCRRRRTGGSSARSARHFCLSPPRPSPDCGFRSGRGRARTPGTPSGTRRVASPRPRGLRRTGKERSTSSPSTVSSGSNGSRSLTVGCPAARQSGRPAQQGAIAPPGARPVVLACRSRVTATRLGERKRPSDIADPALERVGQPL